MISMRINRLQHMLFRERFMHRSMLYLHMWQTDCGIHARGFIHAHARGSEHVRTKVSVHMYVPAHTHGCVCVCVRGYSLREFLERLLSDPLDSRRESLESP